MPTLSAPGHCCYVAAASTKSNTPYLYGSTSTVYLAAHHNEFMADIIACTPP